MSQPSGVQPYRILPSGLVLETTRQLLARAKAKGRLAEIAEVIKGINTRLQWIPLDYGEPLIDYVHLEGQERIGSLGPLVVNFVVDEARRVVYLPFPFKVFSGSGL